MRFKSLRKRLKGFKEFLKHEIWIQIFQKSPKNFLKSIYETFKNVFFSLKLVEALNFVDLINFGLKKCVKASKSFLWMKITGFNTKNCNSKLKIDLKTAKTVQIPFLHNIF